MVMLLSLAVAAMGASAYDRGVVAYNKGDRVAAQLALDEFVAGGGVNAQAYILLGELAKGRGEIGKAGNWYAKAAEVGKGKLRLTGLRCYIYSLTKVWVSVDLAAGDKAAEALEKEYAEDGDARVCRATWWNRRGFELVKSGKTAEAIPLFERSLAARQDFPLFANNYIVALCDLADAATGTEKQALAQKAFDALMKYHVGTRGEGKFAETRVRVEKIRERAK